MKTKIYILMICSLVLITGCSDGWLDLYPSTSIESEGSLKSLRDFEFVLNGAYSSMQSSSYYGSDIICYGDLCGDDMRSYKSSSSCVGFYTFRYNKDNGTSRFWGMYYGIAKNLNILLNEIKDVDRKSVV